MINHLTGDRPNDPIASSPAMRKNQQLNLFKKDLRFFGGSLLHGKRRSTRPLNSKDPIHIVLRSSWAYGSNSFLLLKNKKQIERFILQTSMRYQIKVYREAIVSNHLHLIIKISNRKNYQTFIRVLSSQIASHIMKMQSFKIFQETLLKSVTLAGDPPTSQQKLRKAFLETQGKGQAFWQFRPFTRLLHWGKDFKNSCQYLLRNTLEAIRFIKYVERKDRYQKKKALKSHLTFKLNKSMPL